MAVLPQHGLDNAGYRETEVSSFLFSQQMEVLMRPLFEQAILITGGTDGLGKAMAAELAGGGCSTDTASERYGSGTERCEVGQPIAPPR